MRLQIIVVSIIIVFLIIFLGPVRSAVSSEILNGKIQIIELLERRLNHNIEYESIAPSILHAFEIRGVRISSKDNPDEVLLKLDKLRLQFNIFKFKSSNPLNAFVGLMVINSEINIDPSRNENLLKLMKSFSASNGKQKNQSIDSSGWRLPDNFSLKGRNLGISFRNSRAVSRVDKIFLTVKPTIDNDLLISVKAETATRLFDLPDIFPEEDFNIETGVNIDGRIDQNFNWVDINITTKNLKTSLISTDRLKLNFTFRNPGYFKVIKTGDNIPADISISVDTNTRLINAALQAQNFIFNEYFDITDINPDFSSYFEASVSGNASAEFNYDNSSLTYSADLTAENIKGFTESPADIHAELAGKNRFIEIFDSEVILPEGRAVFYGTIDLSAELPLINGRLKVPNLNYSGFNLAGSLDIKTFSGLRYNLSSPGIYINNIVLDNFNTEIFPYENNIDYSLETNISDGKTQSGTLKSEGIIQTGSDFFIQSVLDIDNLMIAPLADAVPGDFTLPEALNDFQLSTEVFITGNPEQLSFASPSVYLNNVNNENRRLSFTVSGNNSSIRLSEIDFRWDRNRLSGKVSTDISSSNDIILQTDLFFNETALNLAGVVGSDGAVSLTGDYGIIFSLYNLPGGGKALILKSSSLPVKTAPDKSSLLSIDSTGFYYSLEEWKFLINGLSIEGIETGFGPSSLSLSGILSEKGGNIYRLNYSDDNSTLTGNGVIVLNSSILEPSGFVQFNARSEGSAEQYDIMAGFDNDEISGDVDFSGFPLARISEGLPFSGDINGKLSLAGTLHDPQFRISVNTGNTFINNQKLSFETSVYYEDLKMQIENVSGIFGNFTFSDFSGILNLETGNHRLSGEITSQSELLSLQADVIADAGTARVSSLFDSGIIFGNDADIRISAEKIIFNNEYKDNWSVAITKREKLLNLIAGSDGEIKGNFFSDGYFTLDIKDPFPVNISASGIIENGTIDANAKNITYTFDDLEVPFLKFHEGSLLGNIRIQGPLNDPDFFGKLDFTDVVFKPPVVEEISEPFAASFFLSGKEMTLPATRVHTENGTVFINGNALMERWLPRIYELKMNVPEKQAVEALFYKSPVYISGFVTGNLRLYGDFSKMHIDGDLNASEGVFMLNSNLDVEEIGGKGNNKNFLASEMHFTLNENNQFFWPRQDLPILRGFLNSGNKLDMIFDNATVGLMLSGNLELNGGELFYFERNFYIKEGNINFNNSNRGITDPLLSTRAEIRDINSKGEMTKIFLIVDESPLSAFTPRFESEPSMSTAEIISILGGNIFDSLTETDQTLTNAVLLGTDLLTQFAIMKGVEDNLKRTFGLDLLSIRSSFLSNLLESTLFTSSDETSQDNFVKYLDNTTLFLGKYFTNDIFLQGMFQFDLYGDTGYSETPELNFDSELKLEWESPVANVELSFYPDFQDPVAGLNKTSLGLSWRFSY